MASGTRIAAGTGKTGSGKRRTEKSQAARRRSRAKLIRAKRRQQAIRTGLLVTVSAAAFVYLIFTIFFMFHFYPKTTVNGVDVGWMTAEKAKAALLESSRQYQLTVTDCDGATTAVDGTDLNLEFLNGENVDDILNAQMPVLWVGRAFPEKNYQVKFQVSYNEDVLNEKIMAMPAFDTENMVAPVDAYLSTDDRGYACIVPEVPGSTIDTEAAAAGIGNAIQYLSPEVDLTDYRELPAVTSSDADLNAEMEAWNAYMAAAGSTFDFYSGTETLDSNTIGGLLTVNDDHTVSVSEDAVSDLISSWASKYDTYHTSFDYETVEGTTATINGDDGTYGYKMDQDAARQAVMDTLAGGEVTDNEITYSHEGSFSSHYGMGDTYIEVNTTEQHMWLVKDGEVLVSTDVITGTADSPDTETRHGVFYITDKARNITLGTMDVQGYEVDVTVWMRFNDSGQGVHDCTWRDADEFGTDVYKEDGSHGCINTPQEAAQEIYDHIDVGTPIVIYY